MIRKVSTVTIFVTNYDEAKTFYTEKLGFEVRADKLVEEDKRWIEVAPAGAETVVVLYKPDDNWKHYAESVGRAQAMTFEVENLSTFIENLREKEVQIVREPFETTFGTFADILDQDNNRLILVAAE